MTDDLKQLTDKMVRDAEEQVAKAQTMMDQTKALVEIINNQVAVQIKQNEDMNARFKQVGSIMLDAHRILNGDIGVGEQGTRGQMVTPHRVVERQEPIPDLARLRALDDLKRGRDLPAGSSTFSPNPAKRDPDANYPARPAGGLPRAVGGTSQLDFDPNYHGENRRDPGTGTKQPDRD